LGAWSPAAQQQQQQQQQGSVQQEGVLPAHVADLVVTPAELAEEVGIQALPPTLLRQRLQQQELLSEHQEAQPSPELSKANRSTASSAGSCSEHLLQVWRPQDKLPDTMQTEAELTEEVIMSGDTWPQHSPEVCMPSAALQEQEQQQEQQLLYMQAPAMQTAETSTSAADVMVLMASSGPWTQPLEALGEPSPAPLQQQCSDHCMAQSVDEPTSLVSVSAVASDESWSEDTEEVIVWVPPKQQQRLLPAEQQSLQPSTALTATDCDSTSAMASEDSAVQQEQQQQQQQQWFAEPRAVLTACELEARLFREADVAAAAVLAAATVAGTAWSVSDLEARLFAAAG
jgi:hypothetical protein